MSSGEVKRGGRKAGVAGRGGLDVSQANKEKSA
jgi:hypothetical protein